MFIYFINKPDLSWSNNKKNQQLPADEWRCNQPEKKSSDKLWHVPTELLQVCHHCIPEALVMWRSPLSYCPIWHHKQWFLSLLLQGVVSKIWNITLIEMCHWATGIESVKCLAPGLFQLLFTDSVGKMKFESKLQCSVSFSHSFLLATETHAYFFFFLPKTHLFK